MLKRQEEEKEIPLVPITGDNLALYIILAITSLIVLILTGIYGKKNFKKSKFSKLDITAIWQKPTALVLMGLGRRE